MLRLYVSSIAVPAFVAAQSLDPTSQMGPLLSDKQLYRVNGYTEELIKAANDSPYGLGASIWSNNLTQVHHMVPRIKPRTITLFFSNTNGSTTQSVLKPIVALCVYFILSTLCG